MNEHIVVAIIYSLTILIVSFNLVIVSKRIAVPLYMIYDVLDDIKMDRRRN